MNPNGYKYFFPYQEDFYSICVLYCTVHTHVFMIKLTSQKFILHKSTILLFSSTHFQFFLHYFLIFVYFTEKVFCLHFISDEV